MSVSTKISTISGAISRPSSILREAGTPRAVSQDIMAWLVRAIVVGIVVVAPGGLLLLPFLAVHVLKKSDKTDAANAH